MKSRIWHNHAPLHRCKDVVWILLWFLVTLVIVNQILYIHMHFWRCLHFFLSHITYTYIMFMRTSILLLKCDDLVAKLKKHHPESLSQLVRSCSAALKSLRSRILYRHVMMRHGRVIILDGCILLCFYSYCAASQHIVLSHLVKWGLHFHPLHLLQCLGSVQKHRAGMLISEVNLNSCLFTPLGAKSNFLWWSRFDQSWYRLNVILTIGWSQSSCSSQSCVKMPIYMLAWGKSMELSF